MNKRSARIPQLDGLRGIAILLVMIFHFIWLPDFFGAHYKLNGPIEVWLKNLLYSGWIGVDLFFVLSGFLITGILCDCRGDQHYFRNFYLRRTLRIFPLFYLFMAAWIGIVWWLPALENGNREGHTWWILTYTANYLISSAGWNSAPTALAHFWTLAIEEQFYLVWPLAVFFLSRRQALFLSLAVALLCPCLRGWLIHLNWGTAARTFTPCRIDPIMWGSSLALVMREFNKDNARLLLPALGIFSAGLAAIFALENGLDGESPYMGSIGLTLLGVSFTCILGLCLLKDRYLML
jgi:peptidoglycan/LPS O-acetylase OafA/YrhL